MTHGSTTPGRVRSGRPGVFFAPLLLAALLLQTRCDRVHVPAARTEVELDSGSVTLAEGARLQEIRISGPAGRERVDPPSIQARPGDAIRFTAGDALTHAVAFDTAAMAPSSRRFLAETSQAAGPPLIQVGTGWIVSLDGAPPGEYPFHCLAHGGAGRIVVSEGAAR